MKGKLPTLLSSGCLPAQGQRRGKERKRKAKEEAISISTMPPTGFKRSRALWDNARRPTENAKDRCKHYMRAVLYELQPVRFSAFSAGGGGADVNLRSLWKDRVLPLLAKVTKCLFKTLPSAAAAAFRWLKSLELRHWAIACAVLAYYGFVRMAHNFLHAGPLVVILTALIAIFTVGLDDNKNGDGFSAYSVFNRGFRRMLGTVDSDALLAQHVGGGMGMMGGIGGAVGGGLGGGNDRDEGENFIDELDRGDDGSSSEDDDDDDDEGGDDRGDRGGGPGGARLSRKKAQRRRNLEQRREMQRQRDAAMAMGFGGDGEDDELAMQRLIEQQIPLEQQD